MKADEIEEVIDLLIEETKMRLRKGYDYDLNQRLRWLRSIEERIPAKEREELRRIAQRCLNAAQSCAEAADEAIRFIGGRGRGRRS